MGWQLAVISVVDVCNDCAAGHDCILIWLPHHLKTGIFWTNIFLGIIEFNWAIFQLTECLADFKYICRLKLSS